MSTIRINELARELGVKPSVILKLLPQLGITAKLTYTSVLEDDAVLRLRRYFTGKAATVSIRPLIGWQERFLMVIGVFALLAVALRVVMRPEIPTPGSAETWVSWSLFASTMILLAYSQARHAKQFWGMLFLHSLAYSPSFYYMHIDQGATSGILVLISLAATMLIASVVSNK